MHLQLDEVVHSAFNKVYSVHGFIFELLKLYILGLQFLDLLELMV